MNKIMGKLLILILILGLFQLDGKGNFDSHDLKSDLKEGKALIWYLGHAGWAVKTKKHFLIFDYVWVPRSTNTPENPSLADGYIDPVEIKDCSVFVFISQFGSRTREAVNNGDLYTIEKLGPQVTFPMHQGGGERFYRRFAQDAQQKGARTQVICAKKQGDRFFYQQGKIK